MSIDLKHVREAMLHQSIDLAEVAVAEETGKEYLNPKSNVPHGEEQKILPSLSPNFKIKEDLLFVNMISFILINCVLIVFVLGYH